MRDDSRCWPSLGKLALVLSVSGLQAHAEAPGLSIQLNAGHACLCITGLVNSNYVVQYATNLVQANNWHLLTNLTLPTSPYVLPDPSLPGAEQRFYRVKSTHSPLRVAIFSDPTGGSTDADCIQATVSILSTNSGFAPSTISAASIRTGGLAAYDVVMFPGGGGTAQATALQQTGCAAVEQFVANGGGYVGTCAGAYLAALGYNPQTSWLQIVDAQIIDVTHWNRGVGFAQVHIVCTNNPILAGFSEYITARYVNGPLLGPGNSPNLPDYEEDAVYVTDIHDNGPAGIMPGTTCMTCSTYQWGRCVLFSFHPELTPGLEQLDARAVKWCAGQL
jgi:hypothetical protein